MRQSATILAVVVVTYVLTAQTSFGSTIVYEGTLNSFTSTTDSSVDLDPTTKVYAVNLGSSSSISVNNGSGDLTFVGEWPSGVTNDSASGASGIDSWRANPNVTGAGAAELKSILANGRLTTNAGKGNTIITLAVTAGQVYDLQLFMAETAYDTDGYRGGDLSFTNGSSTLQLVDEYALNNYAGDPLVYHYMFKAVGSTVSVIAGRASSFSDPSGMLSGLTLSSIPEPGTMVLMVIGVIGLLCYAWRKK